MTRASNRAARKTAVVITFAATISLSASAASATTMLGDGVALPAGTSIGGPLSGSATLNITPSPQSFTCKVGNFAGTIGTNPLSPSVSVSPTALRLSSCTDNVAAYNITKIELSTSPPAPVGSVTTNSGATGGNLNMVGPVLRFYLTAGGLPGTCNYTINNAAATASATLGNNPVSAPSTVTFIAVPLTTASGVCSANAPATLTMRFSPITVLSPGGLFGQKVTLG